MNKELAAADLVDLKITTQDYGRKPSIEGVELVEIAQMVDDGGSFMEILRANEKGGLEKFPDFQIRQSNYSVVMPGAIKAFHVHYKQEDIWFVPPGNRLLIGLYDLRKNSPSQKVSMRLVLGDGKPRLLYVPRGVAHGCANLGQTPVGMFYFVNQHFSLENPDEQRLEWDILGKDFWRMTAG